VRRAVLFGLLWPQPQLLYVRAARKHTKAVAAATAVQKRLAITLLIIAFAPAAFGCPVCFGAPDDPMVKGVNNGIWVLLALVAVVQVGFAAMFWSFWRRARDQKRFRESLRVIHSFDRTFDHRLEREGPLS
jgi:hypothetical protein